MKHTDTPHVGHSSTVTHHIRDTHTPYAGHSSTEVSYYKDLDMRSYIIRAFKCVLISLYADTPYAGHSGGEESSIRSWSSPKGLTPRPPPTHFFLQKTSVPVCLKQKTTIRAEFARPICVYMCVYVCFMCVHHMWCVRHIRDTERMWVLINLSLSLSRRFDTTQDCFDLGLTILCVLTNYPLFDPAEVERERERERETERESGRESGKKTERQRDRER